jgi:hypothetical protein
MLGTCAALYAADTIAVQHVHPLAALALELQNRYGYAVTYEEAPFDPAKLRTSKLSDGRSYLSAPIVPFVFHMPDVTVGQPFPAELNRVPAGLPDVVLPLIAEYNERAGNGATFSALFDGGYAHIVQTKRLVNGKAEPFQPILGTPVTMEVREVSCSEALDSLLAQVGTARGVRIVTGMTPIGPLMRHRCSVKVSGLPARNVLESILAQLGTLTRDPSLKTLYSWALLHDPNTDKYFLSTSLVPNLNPVSPAAAPTVAPADTTAPTGPSRFAVPTGR